MTQCRGVVHLTTASRVVWPERAPEDCRDTNIGGVRCVLEAAFEQTTAWIPLRRQTTARYAHPARNSVRESAECIAVNMAADIL